MSCAPGWDDSVINICYHPIRTIIILFSHMTRIYRLFLMLLLFPVFAHASAGLIYHGNKVANDQQFPFVVALYMEDGNNSHCTGSIIADRWVLTAEHCVLDYSQDDESSEPVLMKPDDILVGTGHLAGDKSKAIRVISVKRIYIPNNRPDTTLTRDVALLELSEPTGIKPVSLPDATLSSGLEVTAVGYGFTQIKWTDACSLTPDNEDACYITDITFPEQLRFGHEILLSQTDAVSALDYIRSIIRPETDDVVIQYDPQTMLATVAREGEIITNGDSGGPLLMTRTGIDGKTRPVLIGVTSWGAPTPGSRKAFDEMKHGVDFYANLADPVTLDFIKSRSGLQ